MSTYQDTSQKQVEDEVVVEREAGWVEVEDRIVVVIEVGGVDFEVGEVVEGEDIIRTTKSRQW